MCAGFQAAEIVGLVYNGKVLHGSPGSAHVRAATGMLQGTGHNTDLPGLHSIALI